MANPYVPANPAAWPNSPGGGGTDALSALANNVAKGLGKPAAFNGSQFADLLSAPIKFTSGTVPSSPNGIGTVSLYLILSEDGSSWTNGIDPTSTSDQSALIGSIPLLVPSVVVTTTATAYYFPWFSVMEILGSPTMPSYVSLLVYNQSGAAFATTSGSNNVAKYNLISFA
jgi:hypothetical protein